MNAAGDRTEAATKTLTGIPLISTLAPALTMWTAVSDKNINMIVPINKAVLAVKTSDTRLCGGETHLRVKKMSAASDSNKVAIKAITETLTGIPLISNLAPALTLWTAVPDKNKTNMNSTPILGVKRSDSRLPA